MNTTIRSLRKADKKTAEIWRKTFLLGLVGGAAFWLTNLAISLTPIAAEYREALAIVYVPMLLEALLGGLIIGCCVSYYLLRFFNRLPTKQPIAKAVLLSFVALLIVTLLLEVPAKFFTPTHDAWRYFLIGTSFNALRIFALGIVIGYLYDKRYSLAVEQ